MPYFSKFPLMAYDMAGNKQYKLLPDILRRVKLRSGLRSGAFLFDNYDVKDGERPEDIAFKWFGDAEYHWVILMTNNITDRYYQWPLSQPQFQEYLKDIVRFQKYIFQLNLFLNHNHYQNNHI